MVTTLVPAYHITQQRNCSNAATVRAGFGWRSWQWLVDLDQTTGSLQFEQNRVSIHVDRDERR